MKSPINDSFVIGIDVGKTNIAFGIISKKDGIVLFEKETTDTKGLGNEIVNQIISIIDRILEKEYPISSIGLGTFGLIDYRNDIVIGSRILKNYSNIPLKRILQTKYRIPVNVENDIISSTIGEHKFGIYKKLKTIAFLSIGTSVGLGLIVNNRIYRGSHGLAGQIAHIFNPNAESETLNDFISGGGISVYASKILGRNITTADVLELADYGNEKAVLIVEKMLEQIGFIAALIQVIFDPELIILGGGVINNQEKLVNQIETKTAMCLRFYASQLPGIPKFQKSILGVKAGILGAAYLCNNKKK